MAKRLQLLSPLKGEPGDPGIYVGNTEPTDDSVRVWIDPDDNASPDIVAGSDGGYYTPTVTQSESGKATFAWTSSQSDMPTIGSKTISLPAGAQGEKGDPGDPGTPGKSAYQYAQDGGYTGTEEEFAQKLAAESAGGGTTPVWKKLRVFTVPADPSTDTSGIEWTTNAEGGVISFEFDTDYEGNAFECSEFSITTQGHCADTGNIAFYGDDVKICVSPDYQNTGSRAGWGELQKRNDAWRFVFAWGSTLRYTHDTKPINTTGFLGSPTPTSDKIRKFGITGDVAFSSGYSFDIWGR